MKRLSLSVVTPNYNMARYLPVCLESVAAQSRPPDEHIVLDDASTDDSVAIIESYANRYPFIRLLRNERNQGVEAAVDRLFREVRGDFVSAIAADDFVLPGFYEAAMALAEKYPSTGLISGEQVTRYEMGGKDEIRRVRAWHEPLYATAERFIEEYLERETSTHSLSVATVYRTGAMREIGWRHELGYVADHFLIRALGAKYGMCYIPRPCAVFLYRADSYGRRGQNDIKGRLDRFGRIARLMRSAEYRDRFPESHTRRWYRRVVWRSIIRHVGLSLRRGAVTEALTAFRWFPYAAEAGKP